MPYCCIRCVARSSGPKLCPQGVSHSPSRPRTALHVEHAGVELRQVGEMRARVANTGDPVAHGFTDVLLFTVRFDGDAFLNGSRPLSRADSTMLSGEPHIVLLPSRTNSGGLTCLRHRRHGLPALWNPRIRLASRPPLGLPHPVVYGSQSPPPYCAFGGGAGPSSAPRPDLGGAYPRLSASSSGEDPDRC